jgi:multidrug efflux pump subunit AcrA (membrane-fusion protein)
MHPQIHSEKPGECPICHMKLVQVKAQGAHTAEAEEKDDRAFVSPTPYQMQLLGVQKVAVEQMDLTAHIPISGRLISPSMVAFQVYESDIRYVKPGLTFRGQSSFHPEEEIVGTISSVDSIVDPTSRTVRVVGQIKKGPKGLISETTFRGEIEVVLRGVTAIPESSVLHTGNGDLAYMIHDDGTLMATSVKLGQKTESYYEVVEGLRPGEFISSGPNFLIDSEAKIRGTSGAANGHTHH